MSDPRRLLDDDGSTEFEKALVRSWDHEQPSHSARNATLVVLGLGAGAAVTAAAGTSAAAGAGAAAAGGSIAPKAAVGLLFLKWWAISAVAAGTVAGAAYVVHDRSTKAPVIQPPQVQTTAIAPVAPPRDFITPMPTPSVDPAPHATLRPRPTSSSLNTDLSDEVAELDRARAALDGNDASHALELVDLYEAKHPRGAFVQEAEVLRIQALLARGDRAAAERTGNRFLATYPKSPHAARVRSLLGFTP